MNSDSSSINAGPRDVFLHLLAIVTLYISAASFGALWFQYINRLFPDPLLSSIESSLGPLRLAIASLVVVFPVYVWTSWRLAAEVIRFPKKRQLKTRRWLYHFTIFAAGGVMIGDMVRLLYNFLNGDLTARFVLKVAVVFFIAAVVLGYYLWNVRREEMASRHRGMRWFVFGTVGLVAASTIAGFFVAGSPLKERLKRFDEERISDLQSIQWQVINYWQRKEKLPAGLGDLRDEISGFIPPRDPEDGSSYEYQKRSDLTFGLCANFKTEGSPNQGGSLLRQAAPVPEGAKTSTWTHGPGHVCFERTIDPELYRLNQPKQ